MLSKFYAVVTCEGDARWYFRTYEEAKAYVISLFKEDYEADELEAIAEAFDNGEEVDDTWIEDCYFNSYKEV